MTAALTFPAEVAVAVYVDCPQNRITSGAGFRLTACCTVISGYGENAEPQEAILTVTMRPGQIRTFIGCTGQNSPGETFYAPGATGGSCGFTGIIDLAHDNGPALLDLDEQFLRAVHVYDPAAPVDLADLPF